MVKRGGFLAVASSRRKRVKEEKPADFEKITLEFNTVYNNVLALAIDKRKKEARGKYLDLYNIYLRLSNEELTKSQKELLASRITDASALASSKRQFITLKKTTTFK